MSTGPPPAHHRTITGFSNISTSKSFLSEKIFCSKIRKFFLFVNHLEEGC